MSITVIFENFDPEVLSPAHEITDGERAQGLDEDEYGPKISDITGYFMEADGSIYDPEQEEADELFADEVAEYFMSRGIEVQRLGAGRLALGLGQQDDEDNVETESEE